MINPIEVWQVYKKYTKYLENKSELESAQYSELKRLGFDVSPDKNPAKSVGWAIKFSKEYNIDLHGKSLAEVCAAIEKENWQHPIDPQVDQFNYGVFAKRPTDEIESIFAYGNTAEEAVCKCLINARIAGVI